jgi:hypothetical protein
MSYTSNTAVTQLLVCKNRIDTNVADTSHVIGCWVDIFLL